MLVRPAKKRLFCLKAKNGLDRFAPSTSPHYKHRARAELKPTKESVDLFLIYSNDMLAGYTVGFFGMGLARSKASRELYKMFGTSTNKSTSISELTATGVKISMDAGDEVDFTPSV